MLALMSPNLGAIGSRFVLGVDAVVDELKTKEEKADGNDD
jgi:hypothetical protein